MTVSTRILLTVTAAAILAAACSDDPTTDALGSPSLPASDDPTTSVTPGQSIWIAVLAEGPDADALEPDLEAARLAVGDYLAERIVITEPACYVGLGEEVSGPAIVAVQDVAEHGVHAMYLEITDDPLFYGPVTLGC
jgi:hypothetical protein